MVAFPRESALTWEARESRPPARLPDRVYCRRPRRRLNVSGSSSSHRQMEEGGYRGGGTPGGKWGCALSALIGIPLLSFGLIVASMGDCVPGERCTSGETLLLIAGAITIAVGVGSRAAINLIAQRRRRGS